MGKCDRCDNDAIVKIDGEALCTDHVKEAGAWDTLRLVRKLHRELEDDDGPAMP